MSSCYLNKILKNLLGNFLLFFFTSVEILMEGLKCSVVDPERYIPNPDPALNFLSSGSGSRQKFRIHADPDPTHVI